MIRNALVRAGAACAALLLTFSAAAQGQRPLGHDDYDQWQSIRGTAYSPDGKWAAWHLEPQFGDGVLEVVQTDGDVVYRHPLGQGPRFTADGRYVVFMLAKSKVEERQKKIDELRKKAEGGGERSEPASEEGGASEEANRRAEMMRRFGAGRPGGPGAGRRGGGGGGDETSSARGDMAIMDLATGKVEVIKRVKGFTVPEEHALLIYHLDAPEEEAKDDKQGATEESKGEPKAGEAKPGEAKVGEHKPTEPKPTEEKPTEIKPAFEQPTEVKPAAAAAEPAAPTEPAQEPQEPQRPGAGRGGRTRQGPGGRPAGAGMAGRRPGGGGPGAAGAPADPMERKRKEGTPLVVRDLAGGTERRLEHVVSYGTTRKAAWFYYHTSVKKPDAKDTYGLFAQRLPAGEPVLVMQGVADFGGFTSDRNETGLAFTSNLKDFAAEKPRNDLYYWDCSERPARRIVHPGTANLPAGMVLGQGGLTFCRDGSVLQFGLQEAPQPETPEILAEDKVLLDLWHWNDGAIQPAQARGGRGRARSRSAVWHRDEDRIVVLGDDDVEQARFLSPDGSRALGSDGKPYEKLSTWDTRYADVYLINTLDGSRTKVLEKLRSTPTASPEGRYVVWFEADHWHSLDIASGERRNLTRDLGVAFQREDDDHPHPDPAHGIAGWTEHDAAVVCYDQYDLWQVSPRTGEAVCVTDGFGRATRTELRHLSLDRDAEALPRELLLTATSLDTMAEGVYRDWLDAVRKPIRIFQVDKNLEGITKARKADRLFFTVQTFREYPDLWTSAMDFSGMRRLSDANPQQKQFRWGDAELVRWVDADGKPLQGILVKPDGFDPKRQYPMLVYFYEKMSRNLHRYVAPTPGTSPNASYYVSNGYLFFMPDITYEIGYPGPSCVKCVVSGVQHLLAQGFVDRNGIGAAGHSWGGYQTAYLVTRTNIFKAVESGAPVSNMLSAYGGIRYGTGVSRQFQYEQTQSRIGGTPWEFPLRYWENSPIHFADRVNTPVLILHNDQDGAVPWTNGIEYFMALRRLGKEAYLFNYTGEDHGLAKRQNQKDWTRRMAEYFGHHLRGEPKPKWMEEGVPYSEREREKLPYAPSFLEITRAPAPKAEPTPAAPVPATAPAAEPAGAAEAAVPAAPAEAVPAEAAPRGGPGGERRGTRQGRRPGAAPAAEPGGGNGSNSGNGGNGGGKEPASTNPGGVEAMLTPGSLAPDFSVPDETGTLRTLGEFAGKTVVLWFYPKADTPG